MTFVDSACVRNIMSKLLSMALISSLLGLTGCQSSVRPIQNNQPLHPKLEDHSISLTWNQSTVNNGFCSSTVLVSCISGFNEGYISGTATQNQLHNDLPAVCSGTNQPLNCTSTFNGVLPIGNVVFYVVTTFVDQNGVAGLTTAALSPAVLVSADPAQNVKAVVQ